MGGTELVASLFSECHQGEYSDGGLCVERPELAWKLVLSITLALLIKAMLTVVTFGIKLPAGIFIRVLIRLFSPCRPKADVSFYYISLERLATLAVGACTGRITGLLFELLHHSYPDILIFSACPVVDREGFGQKACIIPGVWAMVGAASALAGVTRTTVSLAVIMLYVGSAFSLKGLQKLIWRISLQTSTFSELTGTLSYTVPVMLGILVAKTVADAIEPRSICKFFIDKQIQ
jgi:chloride channel 3/4/5